MEWSGLRFAVSHVLAIGLLLGGTSSAQAQLRPEPDAIKLAPRQLIDRLRASPTDYFRFVNRPWTARVCEGWLRMGVGGALADKILIRVQGPSAKTDDDELVEAKQVQHLGGLPCLEPPPTIQPALRVIAGRSSECDEPAGCWRAHRPQGTTDRRPRKDVQVGDVRDADQTNQRLRT